MTLHAPSIRPDVYEPRERSAVAVAATIAIAILMWGVYALLLASDWTMKSIVLGFAVSATVGAIIIACWFVSQKANAREHRAVLDELAEIREEHEEIITFMHSLRTVLTRDHARYLAGVADEMDSAAPVTHINNWRS